MLTNNFDDGKEKPIRDVMLNISEIVSRDKRFKLGSRLFQQDLFTTPTTYQEGLSERKVYLTGPFTREVKI